VYVSSLLRCYLLADVTADASSSNHLPPYPAAGLTFVQGIYDSILNSMSTTWNGSEGAYINYVDPSLSRADAERLYWGADHYARLSAFKGVWDPTNLFRNPTSVLQI
jgi:FAD/FMN-containing dehydrogenase